MPAGLAVGGDRSRHSWPAPRGPDPSAHHEPPSPASPPPECSESVSALLQGSFSTLSALRTRGPPPSLWTAACREEVLLLEAFLNYYSGADGSSSPHKLDKGLLSPLLALGPLSASWHPAQACCVARRHPAFSREKCHFFGAGGHLVDCLHVCPQALAHNGCRIAL